MQLKTLGGLGLEGSEYRGLKPLLLLTCLSLEGASSLRELAELFWRGAKNPREVRSKHAVLFALIARAEHYAALGHGREAFRLLHALLEQPSFEERSIARDILARLGDASRIASLERETAGSPTPTVDALLATFPAPRPRQSGAK